MLRPTASALLLLGGLLAGFPALAQPAAPAPDAAASPGAASPVATSALPETVLHLSETAQVLRAPDEVRAGLRVEARGASAAAVQAQVNRAMQAALARAAQVPAIRPGTGGYWTQRDDEKRNWVAVQTMTLQGTDAAALLELVGTLQAQGLALGDLNWSLSKAVEQAARQEAGRLAIEALRQRAAAVAQQLGLRVIGIRNLRLDTPEVPMPRMMAMRAQAAAPQAPSSVPEDVVVNSTAAAEVILRP
jgi:predicted secreted protein